jgi:prolyl-tRNA editing enzyme YbaK/EbsC (Cys-tRNA(Pro) deacylase)
MSEALRIEVLFEKIRDAEARLTLVESEDLDNTLARVKQSLYSHKVFTGRFHTMPSDYYDRSLDERVDMLPGCTSTAQLCKSILFENSFFEDNPAYSAISFNGNSKYYLVVVQYLTKINLNSFTTVIHELTPKENRLAKKKFHFRLAPDEISFKLSGFRHNALSPFGMLTPNIPVIICSRCLENTIIYLGGGEVDEKLSLPVSDFIASTGAIVADISDPR